MLGLVGQHMVHGFQWREPSPAGVLGFDPVELGLGYLRRGLALEPNQPAALETLERYETHAAEMAVYAKADALLGQRYFNAQPEAVLALPADLQLALLPELADRTYSRAESADYYQKDASKRDAQLALARRYAETVLTLAGTSEEQAAARYAGTLVLAAVAMREGDRKAAVRGLREATMIARSTSLSLEIAHMARQNVPYSLLDAGEREVVADFYEAIAPRLSTTGETYRKGSEAIRAGRMPENYQRRVARR
jgi:hypothetical protein